MRPFGKLPAPMFITRGRVALIGGAALGIFACSKNPLAPRAGHEANAVHGVDCSAVKAPLEPDLALWEPASRAQLDKLRRQGVVAVRYETHGCEVSLELLPQCVGPKNRYVYSPYSATDTKIARDASELFAKLPLGAANASSLLRDHRVLRMDAKLVGTVGLPAGSTITEYDLVGPECKRATHVISAVYVGGFAMAAADARQVGSTNLFAAPPIDGMTREGQAQICERADAEGIELPGCSVPLRVALAPIGGAAPQAAVPRKEPACSAGEVFDGRRCAPEPGSSEGDGGTSDARVFDQSAVERVVRDKQPSVKRKCWETAGGNIRRVNVTVTTTVDLQGRVSKADAQVVDVDGSADVAQMVARCISGEIQTWQFPEPEKERVLTLPFHLIRQQ